MITCNKYRADNGQLYEFSEQPGECVGCAAEFDADLCAELPACQSDGLKKRTDGKQGVWKEVEG